MYFADCIIEKIDDINLVIKLKNDVCYKGLLIKENNMKSNLQINQKIRIYIIQFWNEFEIFYLFFESEKLRNIFEELLKIKQVGIKTAQLIFVDYNADQFLKIIDDMNVEELQKIKGLGTMTAKMIIEHISKIFFQRKMTQKQEKVLQTLQRLGYKYQLIHKVIKEIDLKLSEDKMLDFAIRKIGHFDNVK